MMAMKCITLHNYNVNKNVLKTDICITSKSLFYFLCDLLLILARKSIIRSLQTILSQNSISKFHTMERKDAFLILISNCQDP